jgi:organic hydroperoxide reductase OsmC/OhrA
MKLELKQVHIEQVMRFFRKGSILGGTIQSGSLGLEVRVDVESDEPSDKIARLVRVAQESCFTHGAIANPVPVETDVRLNGQPLKLR